MIQRFPLKPDGLFDILATLPPGLSVDVGAAAGVKATKMREAQPEGTVLAYEPYPPNWQYFLEAHEKDPRVELVREAAANAAGISKFLVIGVVKDGHGVWTKRPGYSSNGMLVTPAHPEAAQAMEVTMSRLDDRVTVPVRMLKIDVQGHEFEVLDGARQMFARGVDLCHIEFIGDVRVMNFLTEHGYRIFDSEFHSSRPDIAFNDESKWKIVRRGRNSMGRPVAVALPLTAPTDPMDYCRWLLVERARAVSVFTDLVAIAPDVQTPF